MTDNHPAPIIITIDDSDEEDGVQAPRPPLAATAALTKIDVKGSAAQDEKAPDQNVTSEASSVPTDPPSVDSMQDGDLVDTGRADASILRLNKRERLAKRPADQAEGANKQQRKALSKDPAAPGPAPAAPTAPRPAPAPTAQRPAPAPTAPRPAPAPAPTAPRPAPALAAHRPAPAPAAPRPAPVPAAHRPAPAPTAPRPAPAPTAPRPAPAPAPTAPRPAPAPTAQRPAPAPTAPRPAPVPAAHRPAPAPTAPRPAPAPAPTAPSPAPLSRPLAQPIPSSLSAWPSGFVQPRPPLRQPQPSSGSHSSAPARAASFNIELNQSSSHLCDNLDSHIQYFEEFEVRVAAARAAVNQLRFNSTKWSPVPEESAVILYRAPRCVDRLSSAIESLASTSRIKRSVREFKDVAGGTAAPSNNAQGA